MKSEIKGGPAFGHVHVELDPGESFVAESDAMAAMSAELDMEAKFNGGFFQGLAKKFLGGESLFINTFTNNTKDKKTLTITQGTPGDVKAVELKGGTLNFQPGAYLASTPGIKLGIKFAGLSSFIAREGLFKLQVTGTGTVWYGAYGGLIEKEVNGEYIVDTAHLVSYEPQLTLKTQLSGGIVSSMLSGEGLVTRIEGKGKIVLQTRSMSGLSGWTNRFI